MVSFTGQYTTSTLFKNIFDYVINKSAGLKPTDFISKDISVTLFSPIATYWDKITLR